MTDAKFGFTGFMPSIDDPRVFYGALISFPEGAVVELVTRRPDITDAKLREVFPKGTPSNEEWQNAGLGGVALSVRS